MFITRWHPVGRLASHGRQLVRRKVTDYWWLQSKFNDYLTKVKQKEKVLLVSRIRTCERKRERWFEHSNCAESSNREPCHSYWSLLTHFVWKRTHIALHESSYCCIYLIPKGTRNLLSNRRNWKHENKYQSRLWTLLAYILRSTSRLPQTMRISSPLSLIVLNLHVFCLYENLFVI